MLIFSTSIGSAPLSISVLHISSAGVRSGRNGRDGIVAAETVDEAMVAGCLPHGLGRRWMAWRRAVADAGRMRLPTRRVQRRRWWTTDGLRAVRTVAVRAAARDGGEAAGRGVMVVEFRCEVVGWGQTRRV
jgi:hypothetical protein